MYWSLRTYVGIVTDTYTGVSPVYPITIISEHSLTAFAH